MAITRGNMRRQLEGTPMKKPVKKMGGGIMGSPTAQAMRQRRGPVSAGPDPRTMQQKQPMPPGPRPVGMKKGGKTKRGC